MNETVELKHSTREKWRYLLFYWALILLSDLGMWYFRDPETVYFDFRGIELNYFPFHSFCGLFLTPLECCYQGRQTIRVNSQGIYVWQYFRGRHLRWDEISEGEMSWERKFEDFLLTSYGLNNLQGRVKLCSKNRKPLRFKVNFDSMAQRQRLKNALMSQLQQLGLAQDASEAMPFRSR